MFSYVYLWISLPLGTCIKYSISSCGIVQYNAAKKSKIAQQNCENKKHDSIRGLFGSFARTKSRLNPRAYEKFQKSSQSDGY